jgi:hypothetical protein
MSELFRPDSGRSDWSLLTVGGCKADCTLDRDGGAQARGRDGARAAGHVIGNRFATPLTFFKNRKSPAC